MKKVFIKEEDLKSVMDLLNSGSFVQSTKLLKESTDFNNQNFVPNETDFYCSQRDFNIGDTIVGQIKAILDLQYSRIQYNGFFRCPIDSGTANWEKHNLYSPSLKYISHLFI